MKVIFGVGKVSPALKNTVAAIGIFDGVHKGHQWLIRRMVASARRQGARSLVITFHPHPVEVLHHRKVSYLVSLEKRLELFKELGVDMALVIKFTPQFALLEPEDFVRRYLAGRLGVKEVYVGDDFRFGQNRSGDVVSFEGLGDKYGFGVRHMRPVKKTEEKISSSWIRELINTGRIQEAASMLGRDVSVAGKVVHGDARGKTLGYPTANIRPDCGIMPAQGVYIVSVRIRNRIVAGIANIGYRPSFSGQKSKLCFEVHMLDFHKNIYGSFLEVAFLKKIREEEKFSTADELILQIRHDEEIARKHFRKYPL